MTIIKLIVNELTKLFNDLNENALVCIWELFAGLYLKFS